MQLLAILAIHCLTCMTLLGEVQDVDHDGDVLLSSVSLAILHTDMITTVRIQVFITSTLFSEGQSSINQVRQNCLAWRQDEDIANLIINVTCSFYEETAVSIY